MSHDPEPSGEDHQAFLRLAVQLATENARDGGGPFGALVVRGGEVLARGTNRVTASGDPTAHAEIVAVREACRRLGSHQLEGCDIYASSEPCPMCMGALYWARPRRVFYASGREAAASAGFDDQFIYDELARPAASRGLKSVRLDIPEAGAEFEAWSANPHRQEY